MTTAPTFPVQSAQGYELMAWALAQLASNGDESELA